MLMDDICLTIPTTFNQLLEKREWIR